MLRNTWMIAVGALVLGACAGNRSEPVRIWTSEPAIADYVSLYNADREGAPVEVRAIERGSGYRELSESERTPDLIIDRHLVKPAARSIFETVDGLTDDSGGSYYRSLLEGGRIEGNQYLLPLSFDVPAVMFAEAWEPPQDDRRTIDLIELREAAAAFNAIADGRAERLGYSPLWQDDFLRAAIDMFGVRFRSGPDEMPLWSRDGLQEMLEFLERWSAGENEGAETELDFQRRYLVAPGNRAVQNGIAGFWYTTAASYYSLPDAERTGLDVRWLSRDGVLPVGDRVLYAGVPRAAENRSGARRLLRWLTEEAVQSRLISASARNHEPKFGFAGGFSALHAVNERVLSETHPEMTGRVPVNAELRRPDVEHPLWPRMSGEIIVPWLANALRGEEQPALRDRLEGWIRQQEL